MKKLVLIVALILALAALPACSVVKEKKEAQAVAESLLQDRVDNGGFGSATYYSDIFWANTDAENWKRIKRRVGDAMGRLRSYELNDWKIRASIEGGEYPGTFVVLLYDTRYEKGAGMERLTLYRPQADAEFRIVSHNFDSPEIRKIIEKGTEAPGSVGRRSN